MFHQSGIVAVALACALIFASAPMMRIGGVRAAEDAKYPNWKGQWDTINPRLGGQVIKFDPTKPWGPAQQAPLTPEYQKVLEDSMADQAKGGIGNYPTARCLPGGMPRMMAAPAQEYVITPETTYILLGTDLRRIFTDGRDWPDGPRADLSGLFDRPMDRRGRRRRLRRARGRDARPVQRARAPTTPPGCRCTSTMSRSSRSGSISTRPIRTCCTTRSPSSTTP